jgi:hypothetical protein
MSFLNTNFVFTNTGGEGNLSVNYAMVYASSDQWVVINPDGAPPSYDENVGIGWYTLGNSTFGPLDHCTAQMRIDAGVVNKVPFSSDKCSLLFNVNGSNIHLDIHSNGGIAKKGIYGPNPKAVDWNCKLDKVGGTNYFNLKANPAG